MRIVIDLDGTLCPIKKPHESYGDLVPYPEAVRKLREWKKNDHYIIIQTARNMATCESNLGRVLKNVGKITFDWLEKHNIEYNEIYFGKPNAEVYIDDRAIRFSDWSELSDDVLEAEAKRR
ncbi:MAG: HAD hydrolase family protein [Rhodothermales bacterium]